MLPEVTQRVKTAGIAFRSRGEMRMVTTLIGMSLLLACASGQHARSRDEWNRAKAIAEKYLLEKHPPPSAWKIYGEKAALPFLFLVDNEQDRMVLVHNGAVVEQRGLAALDRYLRESRCIEQRQVTAREMLLLLQHLDAFAPEQKESRAYFRPNNPNEAWRPRLDYLDQGRATMTLYYRADEADDEGSESMSETGTLKEWTLTMQPGQAPVWRLRVRTWHDRKRVFVDADN